MLFCCNLKKNVVGLRCKCYVLLIVILSRFGVFLTNSISLSTLFFFRLLWEALVKNKAVTRKQIILMYSVHFEMAHSQMRNLLYFQSTVLGGLDRMLMECEKKKKRTLKPCVIFCSYFFTDQLCVSFEHSLYCACYCCFISFHSL